MTRLPDGVSPKTTGSLVYRSEQIVAMFDAETKDYAFGDSGDAEMYAAEMADILEKWAQAYRTSLDRHPANQDKE
jgi:predicted acetyltransferase